jgi:hypothetical protein
MPREGWVAELNAEVLAWADDYERWQVKAIEDGQFPAVIVPKAADLTEVRLEELIAAWNELTPRVCCVACRKEGSWLDIEQHHWLSFREEDRLYRLARCLLPRADGFTFIERMRPEFRR